MEAIVGAAPLGGPTWRLEIGPASWYPLAGERLDDPPELESRYWVTDTPDFPLNLIFVWGDTFCYTWPPFRVTGLVRCDGELPAYPAAHPKFGEFGEFGKPTEHSKLKTNGGGYLS